MKKWDQGIAIYIQELKEYLQEEGLEATEENLLSGATDWEKYSWGGCSLIYNQDIADRLATPSEIKRVTRKDGTLGNPNKQEHWLDTQARALYQASQIILDEKGGK